MRHIDFSVGAWRSLAARLLWEQEVGGSNPLAPTNVLIRADLFNDEQNQSDLH
jgi:hypothetical protein